MTSHPNNRRLAGLLLLAGAGAMALLAMLLRAGVLGEVGQSRDMLTLLLGGVAALDALLGIVLLVKS